MVVTREMHCEQTLASVDNTLRVRIPLRRGVLDTALCDGMKFVSDLPLVDGFPWVLRFPPSIKWTATI